MTKNLLTAAACSPCDDKFLICFKRMQITQPPNQRQRIIDHGEVFTPPDLVNDMLDLVSSECERIDSRFLEPACGDGNFLAAVLTRRLAAVSQKNPRNLIMWEQDALFGLACLYGIELLHDNVNTCRERLLSIFEEAYTLRFLRRCRHECLDAASVIIRTNILQGDALAMTTVPDEVYPPRPLVFTQWSLQPPGWFKRKQFEYCQLLKSGEPAEDLFATSTSQRLKSDYGETVFIEKAVRDLPRIHYMKLGREGLL